MTTEENTLFIYKLSEDGEHIILDRTLPRGLDEPPWLQIYYLREARQRAENLKHGFFIEGKRFKGALL